MVDFVCAHLPSTLMNDCIDFVDLYGDSIIDILVDQELEPKLVCQKLKLCKASSFTGKVSYLVILPGYFSLWFPSLPNHI